MPSCNSVSSIKYIHHIIEVIEKIKRTNLIFLRKNISEDLNELNNTESAKLQISLAYALASLYYIHNHANNGKNDENLSIVEEIKNIKSYVARLNGKEYIQNVESDGNTIGRKRPSNSIDYKAAKRVITYQISKN